MKKSQSETGQGRPMKVAFLAASPDGLASIAKYLEKRNWTVKVFDAFNDLAKYAHENQLDYIFVSFDIQLPEITKYPQIIYSKFKVPVIPFGETTDNQVIRKLRAHGHDSLLPPISGPLVFSKLNSSLQTNGDSILVGKADGNHDEIEITKIASDEDSSEFVLKSSSSNKILNQNRKYKAEEKAFFSELQKSLSQACETSNQPTVAVTKTKKLTVLPISGGKFTGLLVFVMGDEESVDPMLISGMRQQLGSLNTYIKFDGVMTKSVTIEIDEVDFNTWTSHKAKFVTSSQHRGKEVMMAFFEMEQKLVEIQPSHEDKMGKISLDAITPEVAIDFDAYLYLQSNQKYLKYLHTGSRVSESQIKSLRDREIDSFHIEKESTDRYTAYVARNFLNHTIVSSDTYLKPENGGEEF